MTKILFLDHAPILGGAEKALLDLIQGLGRERYAPMVATAPGSHLLPVLASKDIPAITMPFDQVNMRHPAFLFRLVRSTSALVRIIRRHRPGLVHSNTVRAHIVASLACFITGVPLVWTVHDRTLPTPLFRLFGRVPRRIIFVSQFLSRFYESAVPGHQSQVISNGIEPAPPIEKRLARQNLDLDARSPVILNVGRLIEDKGQDVFLDAARAVSLRWPDAAFVLVGGSNPDDRASVRFAERLSQLARTLDISDKVIFAGQQPEVASYYAASDICTYTAVRPEGFGLVILEAMAHSKAVVASSLGAVSELVCDGLTGRLVRPGDAQSLAGAIMDLLDDPDVLDQMGAAGKQRLIEGFDPKRSFLRTQAVYEEMLASPDR